MSDTPYGQGRIHPTVTTTPFHPATSPHTGTNSTDVVATAFVLIVIGVAAIVGTIRRRRAA